MKTETEIKNKLENLQYMYQLELKAKPRDIMYVDALINQFRILKWVLSDS